MHSETLLASTLSHHLAKDRIQCTYDKFEVEICHVTEY